MSTENELISLWFGQITPLTAQDITAIMECELTSDDEVEELRIASELDNTE